MNKLDQLNSEAWERIKRSQPLTDEKLLKLKHEAEGERIFSYRQAEVHKLLSFYRSQGE